MTPRLPLSRLRLLPLSLLCIALLLTSAGIAGAANTTPQKQASRDISVELERLLDQGFEAYSNADYSAALQAWQKGLELATQVGDRQQAGEFFSKMGSVCQVLGEYGKALEMHEQVLAIHKEVGDREGEAVDLGNMGNVYQILGQYPKALEVYEQALAIHTELGDKNYVGKDLGNMGNVYQKLGQYPRALEMFEQALAISREIGDRNNEVAGLGSMGLVYQNLGQYPKALEMYEQALVIMKEAGDKGDVAYTINNLAEVYKDLGQYPQALEMYEQALAFNKTIGDKQGVGNALSGIGIIYRHLGQYQKALEKYEQALAISREIGDRKGEGRDLANMGVAFIFLHELHKALKCLEQAQTIHRELGDKTGESADLNNLGLALSLLGDYPKALEIDKLVLALRLEAGDKFGEGVARANMGNTYGRLGQHEKGIELIGQGLAIFAELRTPEGQWHALKWLSAIEAKQGQVGEAIFWGKQAVNAVQGMRAGLKEMDTALQRSFVEDKSFCYKDLAALLMREGRMSEAEQVLRMLKEEEYFEFTRRDAEDDPRGTLAAYNSFEKPWAERFAQHAGRLGELSGQADPLRQNMARTEAEGRQLAALDAEIAVEAARLRELPEAVRAAFAGLDRARYEQLKAECFEGDVRRELDGLSGTPAIVSFLVLPDALRILLTTPKEQRPYVAQIGARDLNAKVGEWRQQLLDRDSDPRALGAELYDVLIAPLAADLAELGIDHLALSLDGALRYIPLSALFDGERFLAERFAVSVFTPAAHGKISAAMQAAWRVAGFGASRGGDGLKALPAVKEELRGIVKAEDGAAGVLPGIVRLDADFTAQSLGEALRSEYPAVHIASHFRFTEGGTERDSFLLLGDGTHLNLAELRQNQSFDMRAVDLLALSACDTALSLQDADGREIDGMAVTAQRKGAKAVLASLWAVADASTATLMRDFYRLREQDDLSKAQALRQAQLQFIRGEVQDKSDTASSAHENWTHPYFWAPFILMGNWL